MKYMHNANDGIHHKHEKKDDKFFSNEINDRRLPYHFTQVNDMEDHHKQTVTSDMDHNDVLKKSKQPSLLTGRDKQMVSIPLILTPPKVEDRQIFPSFSLEEDDAADHVHDLSQQNVFRDLSNQNSLNRSVHRKEAALRLLTPFSPMLKYTPSLSSKFSSEQAWSYHMPIDYEEFTSSDDSSSNNIEDDIMTDESSSEERDFFAMEKEETSFQYESSSTQNESSSLIDKFSAMLNDEQEEELIAISDEASSSPDGTLSIIAELSAENDEAPSDDDAFSSLLEESPSLGGENIAEEEFPADMEEHFISTEESSSEQVIYSLFVEESSFDGDKHIKPMDESPSLEANFEKELCDGEKSKEGSSQPGLKHYCPAKEHLPTVKLPILVGNLNIDIDIIDTIPFDLPIEKVTKLEWANQSLDCQVILPSDKVFLKGVLTADIEYVKDESDHKLFAVKFPVPWKKIMSVNWLYPPVMPKANCEKKFMFKSHNDGEYSNHNEFTQTFSEKIESQLRSINFVWYEGLNQDTKSNHGILGRANLLIDLLQEQYVDLRLVH